ncbi:hypothetical protein ABKN59_005588 [Abortiporus biennis]
MNLRLRDLNVPRSDAQPPLLDGATKVIEIRKHCQEVATSTRLFPTVNFGVRLPASVIDSFVIQSPRAIHSSEVDVCLMVMLHSSELRKTIKFVRRGPQSPIRFHISTGTWALADPYPV